MGFYSCYGVGDYCYFSSETSDISSSETYPMPSIQKFSSFFFNLLMRELSLLSAISL